MKKNSSHQWFLIVINIFLLYLIYHQLRVTWKEYQIYMSSKRIIKQVDQLVATNRQLQEELAKVNDPTTLEVRARDKLLLGSDREKIYLLPKELYQPPQLKEVVLK